MRSLLDHQADGIEYTLHTHGIEAEVAGGNISPRLIQFHIKLGAGVKYNRVAALSEELALALGVAHCRITRDGYFVKIEVPRPDPEAVQLFPLMRNLPGDLPFNSAVMGLDESGVPLLLRLDSPDIGHILISGTTGSGKTVLARSMIASLALQNQPDELKLLLLDPKGRGYREFNGLPNLVCPVVTDPADGLHRLKWAVRHMEKRDESGINSPLLVIFIDELADLMSIGGREVESLIARLTQGGREAGIHMVACTQKPATSWIARSNFPTRLVGRVLSVEEARAASGVAGSGADKLMGRGDFLLLARGEISRVQVAHISPSEMLETVVHLGGQPDNREVSRARRRVEPEQPAKRSARSSSQTAPQRQEFQRRQENVADPQDFVDDDYYEPSSRPPRRQFQSALRNEPSEGQGVAERLARYRDDIESRRRPQSRPAPPEDYQDEAETEPTRPARPSRQPAPQPTRTKTRVPQPPTPPQAWEDSFSIDDFDDFEEADEPFDDQEYEAPVSRPTPRPLPAVTRHQSQIDGRNLINDLKTRNSGSFKIGS